MHKHLKINIKEMGWYTRMEDNFWNELLWDIPRVPNLIAE